MATRAEQAARKLNKYEQEAYDGAYGSDWLESVGEGLRFYAEYCADHGLNMTMAGFMKYVDGLHSGEINGGNIPDGYFGASIWSEPPTTEVAGGSQIFARWGLAVKL